MHDWDVFVVAGPSGVGKSRVSHPLARRLGVALTETDDLYQAVLALTTPRGQPALHYWRTHPEAQALPAEQILGLFLESCRAFAPALEAVIADHVETRTPIVLDGDHVLPETVAAFPERVRGVFLVEDDPDQIVRNYAAREPEAGTQQKRAEVSVLHGRWLRETVGPHGLPVVSARPWDSLIERVLAASAHTR